MSNFRYVIAMDFEATCDVTDPPVSRRKAEIIDFPAVLMNLQNGQIEAEFHKFVRPVERPILSKYCLDLTGIRQQDVDRANLLQNVLLEFEQWLREILRGRGLKLPKMLGGGEADCAFVTWGNDFDYFLDRECNRKRINKPEYFNQWINLKEIFIEKFHRKLSFPDSLKHLKMNFIGQEHSGLDDAKNTARIAHEMFKRGARLRITKDFLPSKSNINFSY